MNKMVVSILGVVGEARVVNRYRAPIHAANQFGPECEIPLRQGNGGEYVRYSDYKTLEDKYKALRIVNQDLYKKIRGGFYTKDGISSLYPPKEFHDVDD